jgi:hypothetical protein
MRTSILKMGGIIIFLLIALLVQALECLLAQKSKQQNQLRLRILEDTLVVKSGRDSVKFSIELFNQNGGELKFYCFYNEVNDYIDGRFSYQHVFPGFCIEILGLNGKQVLPKIFFVYSYDEADDFGNATSPDSALELIKRRYGDYENREVAKKRKILDSEVSLLPNQSIKTNLAFSIKEYFLKKGEVYQLKMYYVLNDRIFEFVEKKEGIFDGFVKSNSVILIVR